MAKIFIASILSLSVLAAAPAWAQSQCSMTQYASVPMVMSQWDIPTVPVRINGEERRFFLDTSAWYSAVSSEALAELHLKISSPIPNQSNSLGRFGLDAFEVKLTTRAQSFDVGNAHGKNITLYVIPNGVMPEGIAGILSLSSLRALDVELDYGDGKLNLYLTKNCTGAEVVRWTQSPVAAWHFELQSPVGPYASTQPSNVIMTSPRIETIVKGTLDGHEIAAALDTGRSISAMSLNRARQLLEAAAPQAALAPIEPPHSFPWGVNPSAKFYKPAFQSLELEGVEIKDPNIIVVDPLVFSHDLLLGNSILSRFHLYIANSQKIIYVTGASTH